MTEQKNPLKDNIKDCLWDVSRESLERLRFTLTANGKRQIEVENFSN